MTEHCKKVNKNKTSKQKIRVIENSVKTITSTKHYRCFIGILTLLVTTPAGTVTKYCNEHVCVSVCLSASISPEPHARSLPDFCACCLSPWLGPPLAVWRNLKGMGQFWGFSSYWQCIVWAVQFRYEVLIHFAFTYLP